jgi:signal transduction histidine kinase
VTEPDPSALPIDLLPDPVLVADASGVLLAVNGAALALLGDRVRDSLGQHLGEALDARGPGGGPALRDPWPDGWPGTDESELTFRGADDTDLQAAVTCRAGDGAVVLALRPSDERSGIAIISTVSHELRSPLTSVKGYTSLMLNRWDRLGDDQKRTMLEQVHHDADRVTRLVTELLDISRLETGRLVLRRQMVDLRAIAESVIEKVAMASDDLECTATFPVDLPLVYADPDKVEQVLTNLVENAVKYGSPKGMQVTGRVLDGAVAVQVADTGPGIPAEDLPRVFTKFFRRDHGRPTGTGLGLWISRGLVEAHGGELTATSSPGQGATFRFTLPTDAFERAHGDEP